MRVSVSGDGLGDLKQAVAFLRGVKVRIGIIEGGGSHEGLSTVELAYILTNGSPINRNPPRPFLEPALEQEDVQDKITRHMKAAAKAAVEGDLGSARNQLNEAGLVGENGVKKYMTSGGFAPNSGFTIDGGWMRNRVSGKPFYAKGKGSSNPLIDTGDLRSSITHIVEGG